MRRARLGGLFLVLVALEVHVLGAQPPTRAVMSWFVRLAYADPLGTEARVYRIYGSPEAVTLLLTIANDSGSTLVFDQARLREEVRFTLKQGREIPITATWRPEVWRAGESARSYIFSDSEVQIDPGKGIEWSIVLTRNDGQTFSPGRSTLDIVMKTAIETARTLEGQPWRASALSETNLFIVVEPPTNSREHAAAYRLEADKIEDSAQSIRLLRLATEADPTDPQALIALGNAYLRTRQYREAIPIFERALQLIPTGERQAVPYLLAFAYTGISDETNAVRVLRVHGVSESSIKSSIERYQQTVRR